MRPCLAVRALALAALFVLAGCKSRTAAVGSPSSTAVTPSRFTAITFERTPCFGTCPVYSVTVSGSASASASASVRFTGVRNVDSVGAFTRTIDAATVAALQRAFDDAQYYALDDRYGHGEPNCREYGTDAARIITSITTPDRTKKVDHDLGCANVPTRLTDLYRRFDELVGTARWIGRR